MLQNEKFINMNVMHLSEMNQIYYVLKLCTLECIFSWKTMFSKGVLNFISWKSHFLFFECSKWIFCEAATENMVQEYTKPIFENRRP
jgi:hypothetical protein